MEELQLIPTVQSTIFASPPVSDEREGVSCSIPLLIQPKRTKGEIEIKGIREETTTTMRTTTTTTMRPPQTPSSTPIPTPTSSPSPSPRIISFNYSKTSLDGLPRSSFSNSFATCSDDEEDEYESRLARIVREPIDRGSGGEEAGKEGVVDVDVDDVDATPTSNAFWPLEN
ncbi:hypothetical protein V1478_006910 [Vespula squamosa]|uniref:Uncharacterized protein n=1 Tax=Vespula squamosa TaxID=30214 RepID=A0ABD2B1P4_VESSQ